jgi:hypothetical protein
MGSRTAPPSTLAAPLEFSARKIRPRPLHCIFPALRTTSGAANFGVQHRRERYPNEARQADEGVLVVELVVLERLQVHAVAGRLRDQVREEPLRELRDEHRCSRPLAPVLIPARRLQKRSNLIRVLLRGDIAHQHALARHPALVPPRPQNRTPPTRSSKTPH